MITERVYRLPSLARLRCLQTGQGSVGIVCLSGLGPTADIWRPNLEQLAAPGRTVVALDTPGFGGSTAPRAAHLRSYARVVRELVDALGLERFILIGNSLGGTLAIEMALRWPSGLAGLVLVDAFGVGTQLPVRPDRFTRNVLPSLYLWLLGRGEWAYRRVMADAFCRVPAGVNELIRVGSGPAWWRGAPGRAMVAIALARALGMPWQRSRFVRRLAGQVQQLDLPLLVLWGEGDRMLPAGHALEVGEAIPRAQVVLVQDCGHHPAAERPREFNEVIQEWLEDLRF